MFATRPCTGFERDRRCVETFDGDSRRAVDACGAQYFGGCRDVLIYLLDVLAHTAVEHTPYTSVLLFFDNGFALGLGFGGSLLLGFVACAVVFDVLGDDTFVRSKYREYGAAGIGHVIAVCDGYHPFDAAVVLARPVVDAARWIVRRWE